MGAESGQSVAWRVAGSETQRVGQRGWVGGGRGQGGVEGWGDGIAPRKACNCIPGGGHGATSLGGGATLLHA